MAIRSKKKSGGRTFSYKKRDASTVRKRAQGGNAKDPFIKSTCPATFFKPKEGQSKLRLMPPTWEDADSFGYDIYVHYGVGPDNVAYLDRSRHLNEADPITEEYEVALNSGDEEYAKELRSAHRVLCYVMDQKDPNKTIYLWSMPQTVDKDIALQSYDQDTQETLSVDDPDDGYDIILTREGSGRNTKYTVQIARRSSSIEITDEMLELIEDHPIPEILQFYDYDHIAKTFNGGGGGGGGSDKAASKAKPKRGAAKAKPKVPTLAELEQLEGEDLDDIIEAHGLDVDPDDFDYDEEIREAIAAALGLDDEEEEQPKPKRGRKAKPEPEPDEDDDDDDDDDDSDDEEDDSDDDDDDDDDDDGEEEEPPKRPAKRGGKTATSDRLASMRKKLKR